ncbi:MAG TPA: HD-GYP domain-containing protein [Dissulfurispiraceae bacterium]
MKADPHKMSMCDTPLALQAGSSSSGTNIQDARERTAEAAARLACAAANGLGEAFQTMVHGLADTIDKRDPYTGGHTRRVMSYSLAIGKALGLSGIDMINLKLAAILHDLGKIGISDEVLLKSEDLSRDEFEYMMLHTVYGAEILNNIAHLKDVIPGVKHHHEQYNGSGYPDGLRGKGIPMIARIIAVADTFDAITTDRPYRKGLSLASAFEELKKSAGTQFDPAVVEAFLHACKELDMNSFKQEV